MRIFEFMREAQKRLENDFANTSEICEIFSKHLDEGESLEARELEPIFEQVFAELERTKNYILLDNGEGYFIDQTTPAIKKFLREVNPSERGEYWNDYLKIKNGKQKRLFEFLPLADKKCKGGRK